MAYIIRAKIASNDTRGMFARDWFNCGVNDASNAYETEAEALKAATDTYKGPDIDGVECYFWVESR